MKVVALLTVRNEERYLAQCLEHLHNQGIETCLIDNGSTDSTLEIARSFLGRGLLRIEHFPFKGSFELIQILLNEERLAKEIDADWFIHHDADEIREAPSDYRTLKEGIEDADRQGYNAINFDEFVFLPTSDREDFEGKDYVKEMRYYYFFQPRTLHRLNAWKKNPYVNLHREAGHRVDLPDLQIFPISFILRHYLVLSKAHALAKYATRVHHKSGLVRGWCQPRSTFSPDKLKFLDRSRLKKVTADGQWDRSEPWTKHEFLGDSLANPIIPQRYLQQVVNNEGHSLSQIAEKHPPMPIIVASPRSGTTLLRLMLDAHPDLSIPSETHFIGALFNLQGDSSSLRENFYRIVTKHERWADFHLSPKDFDDNLEKIEPFAVSDGIRCFFKLYAARFNKKRWGDKTPPYILCMHDIQTLLPEARFIHLIRDGRDVALSMKDLWWGPGADMEGQASRWLWRIREARQQAQFLTHYMEVHYEELIQYPRKVLRQICDFIELPYHDAMLDYYRTAANRLDEFNDLHKPDGRIRTKQQLLSIFQSTSAPPKASRMERWRREMSEADRAKFEAVAGSMLRDLGYETGKVAKQLKLSDLRQLPLGPNTIGCQGGSGSRVVARIVRRGGMYIGTNLNRAEDTQDLLLQVPFLVSISLRETSSVGVDLKEEVFSLFETGVSKHLAGLDLEKIEQPWGWKKPRIISILPLLHNLFPNMKFLHLVRDIRDMAFSGNQSAIKDCSEMLLSPSERKWSQPLQSITLWTRLNLLAADYGEQKMPGQYLRVRFEDICFNSVPTIERIFDFFGLSGEPSEIASMEISPPDTIGRWRSQDPEIIAALHRISGLLLQRFGYPIEEKFKDKVDRELCDLTLSNHPLQRAWQKWQSPEFRQEIEMKLQEAEWRDIPLHPGENLEPSQLPKGALGVNIAGYVNGEFGLGEAVRTTVRAIETTGIPFVLNNIVHAHQRNLDPTYANFTQENPYPINLIQVDLRLFSQLSQHFGSDYLEDRYNIGLVAWPLPVFPHQHHSYLEKLDEIWAISSFTAEAISAGLSVPVYKVMHSVELTQPSIGREELGLPHDRFIFLFIFSANNWERKNPEAIVRAYHQAFGGANENVLLVFKVLSADLDSQKGEWLKSLSQSHPSIRVIDECWTKEKINALLYNCDCYVSLHRCEGFGLTMAEAMFYGKPVIATAYSGNLDFMNVSNSFLVNYEMLTIPENIRILNQGNFWAEADVDRAAALMRYVFENPSQAQQVGAIAAREIRSLLSPQAIGNKIKNRIARILSNWPKKRWQPNWESSQHQNVIFGSRLQEIQANLDRSQSRLSQIQSELERQQFSLDSMNSD